MSNDFTPTSDSKAAAVAAAGDTIVVVVVMMALREQSDELPPMMRAVCDLRQLSCLTSTRPRTAYREPQLTTH